MPEPKVDKVKLRKAIKKIAKSLGDDCLIFGDSTRRIERIPIPLYHLSRDIGGGLPKGRLIELFGFEESAKTTLALVFAGAIQRHAGPILYLDPEHSLDLPYAKANGVVFDDRWIYADPNTMEECFGIIKAFLEEDAIAGFIFDSLPAAATQYEMEQDIGSKNIAGQARVISECLRRILGWVSKRKAVGIFINHLKDEIGGNVRFKTHVTPGGRALKFYSSLRLRTSRGKSDYLQNDGIRTIVKVIKTKVGGHRQSVSEYHVRWNKGIVKEIEFYELGLETGIIKRSGGWYRIGGKRIQGRENVIRIIKKTPKLRKAIVRALRTSHE